MNVDVDVICEAKRCEMLFNSSERLRLRGRPIHLLWARTSTMGQYIYYGPVYLLWAGIFTMRPLLRWQASAIRPQIIAFFHLLGYKIGHIV